MANWLRKLWQSQRTGHAAAVALIDASTVYAAGRWYFGLHKRLDWTYADQFNAAEDEFLFHELLHDLLLYDRIILDNSSVKELSEEIRRVFDAINSAAGFEQVVAEPVAPVEDVRPIVAVVCRLMARACHNEAAASLLRDIPVPWYYRTHMHVDHSQFAQASEQWGLNEELIPVALFVYRGLCYSGYANHFRNSKGTPIAYLASPGRLRALQPLISSHAMRLLRYPSAEYGDLVSLLDLPPNGYDFSHLGLQPSHLSTLRIALEEHSPQDALKRVCELRQSTAAVRVREAWGQRVWANTSSCAVGAEWSNVIAGSTIYGDVNMVVHAAAR